MAAALPSPAPKGAQPAGLEAQFRAAIDGSRSRDLSRLKELLSGLAGREAEVAAILKDEYKKSQGDVPRATTVIYALREMGSAEAAEVLRSIALDPGKDSFTLGPRAVKAYAAIAGDSGQMAALLGSAEPQVVDIAIQEMRGLPLADSAVSALAGQLETSKSWVTHQLVAQALGADPRKDTARSRVGILMSGATALGGLEGANKVDPELGLTGREVALMTYAGSLADMKGSGQTLRGYLDDGSKVRQALAATALARQGHRDVHDNVLSVATRSDDGILRWMAVSALKNVVTDKDRPVLEQMAKNDPYRCPQLGGPPAAEPKWRYPVRDAARDVLKELEQ